VKNIKDFLFIIPARKNSKELKNKNILKHKKKMLIEKTFKILDFVDYKKKFVLTDSDIIKKKAKEYLINTDYERPKSLSGDKTELIDNLIHFYNYAKKIINFRFFVILQPTSPLRTRSDLKNAINLFKKKKYKSLFSASKSLEHPNDTFYLKNKKTIFLLKKKSSLRQSYHDSYYINGSIYIFEKELLKKRTLISKKKHGIYYMKKINSLDIDDKEDYNIFKKLC
jgi:hypothetical protein